MTTESAKQVLAALEARLKTARDKLASNIELRNELAFAAETGPGID